jgi:hypothetical protein
MPTIGVHCARNSLNLGVPMHPRPNSGPTGLDLQPLRPYFFLVLLCSGAKKYYF